jgi:hypothetical protein
VGFVWLRDPAGVGFENPDPAGLVGSDCRPATEAQEQDMEVDSWRLEGRTAYGTMTGGENDDWGREGHFCDLTFTPCRMPH